MNKRNAAYGILAFLNRFAPAKRDIIILRMDNIGDFVIWYGAAKRLREYYAGRRITLICRKYNEELARAYGFFDEIITLSFGAEDLRKLAGLKGNILIVPEESRRPATERLASLICAKEKIAPVNDYSCCSEETAKKLGPKYSRLIAMPKERLSAFEDDRYFCTQITGKDGGICLADLSGFVKPPVEAEKYFVLNPSSSHESKNWPAERFAETAQAVWEKYRMRCVVIGTEKDRETVNRFLSLYHGDVRDLTGKTSIPEMISVIGNARFVLTNDTAALHIAAACGIECFCVAHGIHYPRFTSYPDASNPHFIHTKWDCFGCVYPVNGVKGIKPECERCMKERRTFPCLNAIGADRVIGEIFDRLDEENG